MSEHVCEFCQATFSKSSNLLKHQRTVKKCIAIQEEQAQMNIKLTCEYCQRVLSRTDSLHRHYNVCADYLVHQKELVYKTEIDALKDRLAEKDAEISDLKQKMWKMTNVAMTTPRNNYTHIDQVTINNGDPDMKSELDKLSEKIASDVSQTRLMLEDNVDQLIDDLCKKVLTNISQNQYLLT